MSIKVLKTLDTQNLDIVFYCPSDTLGGTEILFFRLIKKIAATPDGNKVYVLDIHNGVLTRLLGSNPRVDFITIEECRKLYFPIVFAPVKCLHLFYDLLSRGFFSSRLCVWQLGSGGFSETLFLPFWLKFGMPKSIYKTVRFFLRFFFYSCIRCARNFVYNLERSKSIFFTDHVGALETFYDLDVKNLLVENLSILPVFVDPAIPNYLDINVNSLEKEIRVGWLGRISTDFKIHSLIYAMNEVIHYAKKTEKKVVFHIIGDGDAFEMLKEYKSKVESDDIEIVLYGILDNETAVDLLLRRVDIAIGMGTSALDAAKVGIPTIIISPITNAKDLNMMKSRFLYDSQGFSLGEFPNDVNVQGHSADLKSLISYICQNKTLVSQRTYDFVSRSYTTDIAYYKFFLQAKICNYETTAFVHDFRTIYKMRKRFKTLTKIYKPEWLPG